MTTTYVAATGWYPQADGTQRYWDGSAWGPAFPGLKAPLTVDLRDAVQAVPTTQGAPGRRNGRRIAVGVVAAVASLLVVGGLVGSRTSGETAKAVDAVVTAPAAPAPAVPAPAAPAPTSAGTVERSVAASYSEFLGRFGTVMARVTPATTGTQMMAVCADLIPLAAEGLALPPTGIAAFDSEWQASMTDLSTAAVLGAGGDFAGAAPYLARANTHLEAANGALPR